MSNTPPDAWNSSDSYEQYIGRWSRQVAREFIRWLDVPTAARWLDVGCGTGALSEIILANANPAKVLGIDPSEEYIAHARAHLAASRARFEVASAQSIPAPSESVDVVVSGLMLNFVPAADLDGAMAEMGRVARSGGTIAAYVWDYAGEMQLMRHFWDSAVALDSVARDLDEGVRFPLCQPEPLAALFHRAGLDNVEVRAIDAQTIFLDFDDYWSPFLGGQGPAPGYAMSLSEVRRDALRERVRADLPIRPDGSIHLMARAWSVRGECP